MDLYYSVLPRAAPLMNDGPCRNFVDIANVEIYYGNNVEVFIVSTHVCSK